MVTAKGTSNATIEPPSATDRDVVSRFFRGLGDPTRLALLEFLREGEHNVSECVEHVGLSQGRVSVHLGCLTDCGFVCVRREGRFAYYSVADPRVSELIALSRAMVADNKAGIAGCAQVAEQAR